ncbi:MAG: signal peptidase I [Neptuniibacter sp.]
MDALSYEPERWHMVLYKTVHGSHYIGRIVGLPNEEIQLHKGLVLINKKEVGLPEKLRNLGITYRDNHEFHKEKKEGLIVTHLMGENEYFVLGDNSAFSYDSRTFGGVKLVDIVSEVQKAE